MKSYSEFLSEGVQPGREPILNKTEKIEQSQFNTLLDMLSIDLGYPKRIDAVSRIRDTRKQIPVNFDNLSLYCSAPPHDIILEKPFGMYNYDELKQVIVDYISKNKKNILKTGYSLGNIK